MRIALTGGTGFIGRHLVSALVPQHQLRILVRRPERTFAALGAELVPGGLDRAEALARLVAGAEVVIHAAAAIQAPSAAAFDEINHRGTRRLVEAALRAGVRRFIFLSSLAARAPQVSAYARSKAAAEEVVAAQAATFEAIMVRPPAIYGPGDRATLALFRGFARGRLLLPANRQGRFSLLFVSDLVDLLCELVTAPVPSGIVLEPDDGKDGGYDWHALAKTASQVLGHPVHLHFLPQPAAPLIASLSELVGRIFGMAPVLTRDKVGELYYRDWVCRGGSLKLALAWRPLVPLADGLRRTFAWYQTAGWLPPSPIGKRPTMGDLRQ